MKIAIVGDRTTIRKMSRLIGNTMRVVPHVNGTLVVDLSADYFYVLVNTGRLDVNNTGVYEVVMVGLLERLMELLVNKKLGEC